MIDINKSAAWFLVAFGLLWGGITFWPVSWWLKVQSVQVSDAIEGEAPKMQVARVIKRPFIANWRVELEMMTDDGFVLIQSAEGHGRYAIDNRLPVNLDLDWWTHPKVMRPQPGQYRLETCWTLIIAGQLHSPLCVQSNTFTITEK
jgi:hypothetical protein